MIKLDDSQRKALSGIKTFVTDHTGTNTMSLTGNAGSGKTVLLGFLIRWLERKNISYRLAAPTHKAALVLKANTSQPVMTLHKLLSMSPKIDILNLDLNQLLFKSVPNPPAIPAKGLVIVDEASMISKDLFECLVKKCQQADSKILFVGDPAQLLPVKDGVQSPALCVDNTVHLEVNHRQGDETSLLNLLQHLRDESVEADQLGNWASKDMIVHPNALDFTNAYMDSIRGAIKQHDVLAAKIAAYTNTRVGLYNALIHKMLAGNREYKVGEFVTCGENLIIDPTRDWCLFNSMDYIVASAKKTDVFLSECGSYPGYSLRLFDPYACIEIPLKVLSTSLSPGDFLDIAEKMEEIRRRAVLAPQNKKKILWDAYYRFQDSFTTPVPLILSDRTLVRARTLGYGYASTVHKLQGSSYNKIFIDWQNIASCHDLLTRRQLQYVALSRTRTEAHIL